ncbi:MAG: AraC family transcriptional regulator [Pseudomonadota bacterium]
MTAGASIPKPNGHDCFRDAAAVQTEVLQSFEGRRLRASRLVRRTVGIVATESRQTHSLIFHMGGGTAYRHDGRRRTGRANHPGTTTLVPAHLASAWDLSEGIDLLQVQIEDSRLRRFASREFDIDPDRLEMHDLIDVADPFMRDIAPAILRQLSTSRRHSDAVLDNFDTVLSSHILRTYSNLPDIASTQPDKTRGNVAREAVRRARDILLDNLDKNISATKLADEIGIGPFRLMRCFKAEMGVSLHRFVIESRVALVRDRLLQTDAPLIQIALDAGFANQSHMTSTYTAVMGITPGRHRREMRG